MAETSEMVERVRNAIDKAWMDWNCGDGRGKPQADVPVELLAAVAVEAYEQALAEGGLAIVSSPVSEILRDAQRSGEEIRKRGDALRAGLRHPTKRFKL